MNDCLVCGKLMTVLRPSESGGFKEECSTHGSVSQQVKELKLRHDCLRADNQELHERVERLREALQTARCYLDGTLGDDRPVAVAGIDKALEEGK